MKNFHAFLLSVALLQTATFANSPSKAASPTKSAPSTPARTPGTPATPPSHQKVTHTVKVTPARRTVNFSICHDPSAADTDTYKNTDVVLSKKARTALTDKPEEVLHLHHRVESRLGQKLLQQVSDERTSGQRDATKAPTKNEIDHAFTPEIIAAAIKRGKGFKSLDGKVLEIRATTDRRHEHMGYQDKSGLIILSFNADTGQLFHACHHKNPSPTELRIPVGLTGDLDPDYDDVFYVEEAVPLAAMPDEEDDLTPATITVDSATEATS